MATLKRFFWVRGPSSVVRHVKFNRTGPSTICGTPIGADWRWVAKPRALPACKKCYR